MTSSNAPFDRAELEEVFAELARRPGRPPWDDRALDLMLGLDERRIEAGVDTDELRRRHGYEQWAYGGVGYHKISLAWDRLGATVDDVVYELGCGYGRVLIYGALTTPARRLVGIERVEKRCRAGIEVRDRLGLERLEFITANVLDCDLSDGTIFFVLNAFSNKTLREVVDRLEQVARARPIRVVSVNWSNLPLAEEPWLEELDLALPDDLAGSLTVGGDYGLRIFASV